MPGNDLKHEAWTCRGPMRAPYMGKAQGGYWKLWTNKLQPSVFVEVLNHGFLLPFSIVSNTTGQTEGPIRASCLRSDNVAGIYLAENATKSAS